MQAATSHEGSTVPIARDGFNVDLLRNVTLASLDQTAFRSF
jgi:hypothetical protein